MAQVAGAIVAALVLYLILSGKAAGWNGALGQTTWSEYSALSAFIFEVVGTFLFSFASSVSLSAVHLWNWPVSRSD